MQTNPIATNPINNTMGGSTVVTPWIPLSQINLQTAVEDMMLVLNVKEKEVLVRRFSLQNNPRETLDSIWKKFSITRERVRQIEWNALSKLRRTAHSSQLKFVNKEAETVLSDNGGVILEEDLIASILNSLWQDSELEWNMIRLSLSVDIELAKNSKSKYFYPSWRFNEIKILDIETITNAAYELLAGKWEVSSDEWIVSSVLNLNLFKNRRPTEKLILSCLKIDSRIHKISEWWGLMEWRNINPKSIRDKASIILQKENGPLHFIEIANKVAEIWFRKKSVTIQAVHNELIKYDDFVLVWRWVYGLKWWWMMSWSVSDVIEAVIKQNWEPMAKHEIVSKVQQLRDVKIWTISLNLQNNNKFVRVGRAVYDVQK